ncbi:RHS repeat-associated protein [Oxalobacteraceae bacterium GrIS 1.11]
MKRHLAVRAVAGTLIFTLAYTPILGAMTGTVAAAQAMAVQNTTYSYGYDPAGNLKTITDPLNKVSNFDYDALNRLKLQTQPPAAVGAARPAVAYTYDGLDQLSTVTDPRKLVTTYTNDGLGNAKALASPDTGPATSTYDAAGNLQTRTDARGIVTTYSYDALNRVTRIATPAWAATTFEYDGGVGGPVSAIGRLSKMTDESGNTTYSYDAFGRLAGKVQTTIAGPYRNSLALAYTYANGRPASVTYPSGNRINYAYDAAGQVNRVTLNPVKASGSGTDEATSIDLLVDIAYMPFGAARAWNWGNSKPAALNSYARSFDLDGRVSTYTLGNPLTTGVLRTLHYDAASRILGITHTGAGTSPRPASLDQGYGYDDLNRLTSFTGGGTTQAFQYDLSGNRTVATFGANSYTNTIDATSNKLNGTNGPLPAKSNHYDNAGNLINDGSITYVYSQRNRMYSATIGSLTVTQQINGLGQRVLRGNRGGLFAYDEQGHLIGEYDSTNGKLTRETVYLGDLPVAVLTQSVTGTAPAQATATNVFHVYPDHLGTPRLITRATDNKIVWRWDNGDAFGLTQPNENPSALGTFTYNLRMPGQYYDRDTNLFYNSYRDYDPQQGRYVQSDPIGLGGGINTYAYVGGNPVSYVDPDGKMAIILPEIIIFGGLATYWWITHQHPIASSSNSSDKDLQQAIEKEANKREYKSYCDGPPPPSGNACDDAQNEQRSAERCKAGRDANTNKWWQGLDDQHSPQMSMDLDNRIARAKRAVKANCPASCTGK